MEPKPGFLKTADDFITERPVPAARDTEKEKAIEAKYAEQNRVIDLSRVRVIQEIPRIVESANEYIPESISAPEAEADDRVAMSRSDIQQRIMDELEYAAVAGTEDHVYNVTKWRQQFDSVENYAAANDIRII